jgi:hypothetical protein
MEFKVGDRVLISYSNIKEYAKIVELPDPNVYHGFYRVKLEIDNELGLVKPEEMELVTTANEADKQEANAIVKLLDNYVVFDKPDNERFIGKPGLALSVIIELLVSKGSLSLQDVERFLSGKAR